MKLRKQSLEMIQPKSVCVLACIFIHLGAARAQDDAASFPPEPSVTEAPAPRRSDDSNGAHIESLIEMAHGLISSAYPSSSITNVADLPWPATVVVGSSTRVVSDPSAAPAESTMSAPSAGSDANSEPSGGGNKNLGLILGVVFGVVALLLILLVACLCWRRRSRKRSSASVTSSENDMEAWKNPHGGNREFPEKYATRPAPPPPRTSSPPFNRYSADDETLTNPFDSAAHAPVVIHPAHRNENGDSPAVQLHTSPYYAPHLHNFPAQQLPPKLSQQPSRNGMNSRDSGYSGDSYESQAPPVPATYSSPYNSDPFQGENNENPFTSPAYNIRSQSPHSIKRRSLPNKSSTSLHRISETNLSSPLAYESSNRTSDSSGAPYVPARSPKRKSGGVYYPPPSETSDFDFEFGASPKRFSFEAQNLNTTSSSERFYDIHP